VRENVENVYHLSHAWGENENEKHIAAGEAEHLLPNISGETIKAFFRIERKLVA